MKLLKAPFPYMGGKVKVAAEVWARFGDPANYVEPFFGSGAVLLRRPPFDGNRIETVNDADGHLANFWRAVRADPDAVAAHADWPVSELDLHARGDWLYYRPDAAEWVERLRADPDYYDVKSAGWWVWFASCWIGGLPSIPRTDADGITRVGPGGTQDGVKSQLPHLGDAGMGVSRQRPHLGSGGQGNGVHAFSPRLDELTAYMRQLAGRLSRVRVICGDWKRVTGPSVTYRHGVTAVFLDPPYSHDERAPQLYSVESGTVSQDARQWAIENGDNPLMRIALCGYDTEHGDHMPDSWHAYAWKTRGGYGLQGNGRGRANAGREVVWFSPHCLNPIETMPLFAAMEKQS